jgi:hypothetical protein
MQPMMEVRTLEHLTGADYDAGVAALAQLVGDEALRPEWFRRLVLRADGAWLLSWRQPRVSRKDLIERKALDVPARWSPNSDLAYENRIGPLADVVALLRAEENDDAEVARRQRLWREHLAAEEQRRADEAAANAAEEVRRKEFRALRPERWAALPHEVRCFYTAASMQAPITFRETMLMLARLFGTDPDTLLNRAPPATFEPENA